MQADAPFNKGFPLSMITLQINLCRSGPFNYQWMLIGASNTTHKKKEFNSKFLPSQIAIILGFRNETHDNIHIKSLRYYKKILFPMTPFSRITCHTLCDSLYEMLHNGLHIWIITNQWKVVVLYFSAFHISSAIIIAVCPNNSLCIDVHKNVFSSGS